MDRNGYGVRIRQIGSDPGSQDTVELDHGTGSGMSHELISGFIAPHLGDVHSGSMEDSTILPVETNQIAVTTDSFVVNPIFFGGGDIGKVAVCGTVNDLAVSGAVPRFLTLSLMLEVGFSLESLARILDSIRKTATEANVAIVAGDTKVVGEGEVDQIFINTAGVGEPRQNVELGCNQVANGDSVIVSGFLGNHALHLLSLREGLGFESRIDSDCAPLVGLVSQMLESCQSGHVHCIRDVTRGGLGTVLNEVADQSGLSIQIDEDTLPLQREAVMAADMLGVNPMYLANEGCLCVFVDSASAADALAAMRSHPYGQAARIVGTVNSDLDRQVTLRHSDGTDSVIGLLYGAELPRLC